MFYFRRKTPNISSDSNWKYYEWAPYVWIGEATIFTKHGPHGRIDILVGRNCPQDDQAIHLGKETQEICNIVSLETKRN